MATDNISLAARRLNDGVVRVTVPLEEARPERQKATVTPRASRADIPRTAIEVFASALDLLTDQIEREKGRADRAEARIAELTELIDRLRRSWWRKLFGSGS